MWLNIIYDLFRFNKRRNKKYNANFQAYIDKCYNSNSQHYITLQQAFTFINNQVEKIKKINKHVEMSTPTKIIIKRKMKELVQR